MWEKTKILKILMKGIKKKSQGNPKNQISLTETVKNLKLLKRNGFITKIY